jgi:GR25 family glycosyltransferase involved in LPS biosynthesis
MSIFPKTFCITLKNYPKRTNYATNHFKEHDLDVEMFEGIDGKGFGLQTRIPYTDDNPDWNCDHGSPYFISQGHVGCILSHYMLWRILEYLPYGEYLIFEDDVVLCEGFKEKFIDIKSKLPEDWQYCFIGNCCLDRTDSLQVADGIIQTVSPPLCTHAYLIKKTALPTLIKTNSVAWVNIDIQIQKRSLKELPYYVFDPSLALQRSIDPNDCDFKSLTYYE